MLSNRRNAFKICSTMASITKKECNPTETLPALFGKGLSLHDEIAVDEGDQRSDIFQNKVRRGIMILEDTTRLVSVLDLFSRNENVSDMPTESLKFLLLPVLLGSKTQNLRFQNYIIYKIWATETFSIYNLPPLEYFEPYA